MDKKNYCFGWRQEPHGQGLWGVVMEGGGGGGAWAPTLLGNFTHTFDLLDFLYEQITFQKMKHLQKHDIWKISNGFPAI